MKCFDHQCTDQPKLPPEWPMFLIQFEKHRPNSRKIIDLSDQIVALSTKRTNEPAGMSPGPHPQLRVTMTMEMTGTNIMLHQIT